MEPLLTTARLVDVVTDLRTVLILILGLWHPWTFLLLAGLAAVVHGARLLTAWTPQPPAREVRR